MDESLGNLVFYLVGHNTDQMNKESQELFRNLHLNESLYFSHVIKGYAAKLLWPEVSKLIKMNKPPVPYATMAEIVDAAGNRELASETFCKV